MDNSRCRCYRARPVFNFDNKAVVRNGATCIRATDSDGARVHDLRAVCKRVDVACQRPRAPDVLVRPRASVRGRAASRHLDRGRRRGTRACAGVGCRQLRRHRADERVDAHDSDRRGPRRELDAPRLDRRRARRARRRRRGHRHGRTERYGGVRDALHPPRNPHGVERPGLPRSARFPPRGDHACAREGAPGTGEGVACVGCSGRSGDRCSAGRGPGGVGSRSAAGRGSSCTCGSGGFCRDARDAGQRRAGGGGREQRRPGHDAIAAAGCSLKACRLPCAACARVAVARRSRRDSAQARARSNAEGARAPDLVRHAARHGRRRSPSGTSNSGRSPTGRAGAACGLARRDTCGSPRDRTAPQRAGGDRRAACAGGRGGGRSRGRSYDHEPLFRERRSTR
jgi:hypothetical protein